MTVWDLLVGQKRAAKTLKHAATEGRAISEGRHVGSQRALSHAWLITGPPGSGRSTAARALAAALQCTGNPVGCGQCNGCRTTLAGTNPNVQVHDTDLVSFKIRDVRAWVREAYGAPLDNKWKVTIVEDADRMSERTSNVLLKSIEEPPERGVWILCAPSAEDVLPTVRSRSRHLALVTPSVEDVAEYLVDQEGVSEGAATEAATLAQSHVGFARALLRNPQLRTEVRDMLLLPLRAASPSEAVFAADTLHGLAKEAADAQADRVNAEKRRELYEALGIEDGKRVPPALRAQVRALEDDEKRRQRRSLKDMLDRVLVDLLGFYRDVLTVQLETATPVVNVDMRDQIQWAAENYDAASTLRRVDIVEQARRRLQTNAAPLLVLESMMVALTEPSLAELD